MTDKSEQIEDAVKEQRDRALKRMTPYFGQCIGPDMQDTRDFVQCDLWLTFNALAKAQAKNSPVQPSGTTPPAPQYD